MRKSSEQYLAVTPNPYMIEKFKQSKAAYLLSIKGNANCKGEALKALIHNAFATTSHCTFVIGDGIHKYNMKAKYPDKDGKSKKELREKKLIDLCEEYWGEIFPDIMDALTAIISTAKNISKEDSEQLIQNLHDDIIQETNLDKKCDLLNNFLKEQKLPISFERYDSFLCQFYKENKKQLKEAALKIETVANRIESDANEYVDKHSTKYHSDNQNKNTEWLKERERVVNLEKAFFLEETLAFTVTAIMKGIKYLFYPGDLKILECVAREFCNPNSKGIVRESDLNKEFFQSHFKDMPAVFCCKLKLERFRTEDAYNRKWNGKSTLLKFLPLINATHSLIREESTEGNELENSDDSTNTASTDINLHKSTNSSSDNEQPESKKIERKRSGTFPGMPIPVRTKIESKSSSNSFPPMFFNKQNQSLNNNVTSIHTNEKDEATEMLAMAGEFFKPIGSIKLLKDPEERDALISFLRDVKKVTSQDNQQTKQTNNEKWPKRDQSPTKSSRNTDNPQTTKINNEKITNRDHSHTKLRNNPDNESLDNASDSSSFNI